MTLFFAATVLAIWLLFTYACVRRTEFGFVCVVLSSLLLMTVGEPQAVVGGIHLSAQDLLSLCLLAAGVIRTARYIRILTFTRILGIVYLALFAFSLMRGFASNGLITTSNESRGMLGELLVFLYFVEADVEDSTVRRYVRIYIGYAVLLCVIAVLAAAGLPVGSIAVPYVTAGDVGTRFINADTTGAIATSWVLLLSVNQYRKRGAVVQLLSIVFLIFALYMRHRTVWVLLIGCFVFMPLVDRKLFFRILPAIFLSAVAIGGLAIYANTHMTGAAESDFSDAASNSSTFLWRVNTWEELFFEEGESPAAVLVGKSMGSGYWRIDPETHLPTTAPPHNEFMQNYTRVGAIGAFCMMTILLRPIFVLWRASKQDMLAVYPSVAAWALVALGMLLFSFTYSLNPHQFALVGIANALSTYSARRQMDVLSLSDEAQLDSSLLHEEVV